MHPRPLSAAAVSTAWLLLFVPARAESASIAPAPLASSYADEFSALAADARAFDRGPDAVFSYCVRNTAVYECLSYRVDGAVRRARRKVLMHGTAFAYKRQGEDTLLLTNDHVAAWPQVTDEQHVVDGVPAGCKKVTETLALVDDEHDEFSRDDVPVSRVVTDPLLDVAILKTPAPLHVMRWKIGRSAALHERNVVEVRGFPLGAFRATNAGKVISVRDHDDFGEWDHDDFVVDALLSSGNSGSPVLAVSSATGEYELVGVYHAGYSAGSALNVVVGIDQVREMMTTLKRAPRLHRNDGVVFDSQARVTIQAALGPTREMYFPFGSAVALVRSPADGMLLFAVFPKNFPFSTAPVFVAEEVPGAQRPTEWDTRIWFGSPRGLKPYERSALDADAQLQASRILEALRDDALGHALYRDASASSDPSSRQGAERIRRMDRALSRTAATRGELLQAIADLADRLAPPAGELGATFATVAYPAPPPESTPPTRTGRPGTVAASAPPVTP